MDEEKLSIIADRRYLARYSYYSTFRDKELIRLSIKYLQDGCISPRSKVVGIVGWYKRGHNLNQNQRDILLQTIANLQNLEDDS